MVLVGDEGGGGTIPQDPRCGPLKTIIWVHKHMVLHTSGVHARTYTTSRCSIYLKLKRNAKIKAESEQKAQYTTRWSLFVAETWMSSLSLSPAARPVFVSDQLFVCCLSAAGLV